MFPSNFFENDWIVFVFVFELQAMLPAVKIKNLCRQKAKKPYPIGAAFSLLVQHPQTPSNLFCSNTKQSYTPAGLKTGVTIKTKQKQKWERGDGTLY